MAQMKKNISFPARLGPSSNVAFLRFIVRAIGHPATHEARDHPVTDNPAEQVEDGSYTFLRRPPCPESFSAEGQHGSREPVEPFALPPTLEAEQLLKQYFATVNLMIPCIHEDSFRSTWAKARSEGSRTMSRPWLGVFNMTLALASNVMTPTSPPRERAMQSNMYFERAMELARAEMLGRPSVELVQLFLLMEIYLEGSKNLSQLDREVRRRLWYWCVINDRQVFSATTASHTFGNHGMRLSSTNTSPTRWLSVTYGRPPLISISHINPEPTLNLAFSNVPSGITTSSLAFFDAIMSITHIMGDVLDRIYDQNLGFRPPIPTSEALNHISQILWRLAQWQDNLPDYLKVISASDASASETVPPTLETTRLRVLLSLRYFGARILVLRPAVIQFFDLTPPQPSSASSAAASGESNAQSRLLRSSGAVLLADMVRTCGDVLHISRNIILAALRESNQNLLGAWWFSCYYTFNAALALLGVLAIKRMPAYTAELSTCSSVAELRVLLDTALEILRDLDKGGNKTILRCRDTLAQLLTAFDSAGQVSGTMHPSFSFSPSNAWALQLMEPGLFGSELASMCNFASEGFDVAGNLHLLNHNRGF
ncbi:hypothetical protein B0T19DRAFT_457818 [Cercophora scortea]|uniref:Transcription factor domain-containing protein n=1 Tax=Cercophora scortea TaxID=314031 RepID=A0AAE0IX11_9PEZI|nr:hypothetical protein B0T19DRAFT_457818 [Cercophora scortea]